jgi:hypothetical protein
MEKLFLFLAISLMMGHPIQTQTTQPVIEVTLPIQKPKPKPVQASGFMEAIAFKESRGIIDTVNRYGMLGKYQFSRATLNGLGYKHVTDTTFLKSEPLQDEAMVKLLQHNEKILRKQIFKYSGEFVDSVYVTKSGILAAAHLAGPSNVKQWLRTDGKKTRVDGFGTSIKDYMKKFANYKINI